MVFLRDFGVGRHDLNPQNSPLFLRVKSDARLACSEPVEGELTQKSSFLDGHELKRKKGVVLATTPFYILCTGPTVFPLDITFELLLSSDPLPVRACC